MKHEWVENIDAVERQVRGDDRDGTPTRTVIAERTYDAAITDVWDALTNRERIPRWLLPVQGDLRLGGPLPTGGQRRR